MTIKAVLFGLIHNNFNKGTGYHSTFVETYLQEESQWRNPKGFFLYHFLDSKSVNFISSKPVKTSKGSSLFSPYTSKAVMGNLVVSIGNSTKHVYSNKVKAVASSFPFNLYNIL